MTAPQQHHKGTKQVRLWMEICCCVHVNNPALHSTKDSSRATLTSSLQHAEHDLFQESRDFTHMTFKSYNGLKAFYFHCCLQEKGKHAWQKETHRKTPGSSQNRNNFMLFRIETSFRKNNIHSGPQLIPPLFPSSLHSSFPTESLQYNPEKIHWLFRYKKLFVKLKKNSHTHEID